MSVVKAENISKLFRINDARTRSVRDAVTRLVKGKTQDEGMREIWALRDVGFSIEQGDTLGVLGRNGAGKSTLLKILSRITKPTSGSAEIRGRVGSLLEVGTGFHSELSGRENVYLNGAILGMKRAEIDKKFDEIVAFSEVEDFLDTPVKHFSSGMYMRLAFSVAAHLEPEVLMVDEVLAVGDAVFQNKCLGKMDAVSRSGRTVLFVSHNLGSLAQICNKGLLLHKGQMHYFGNIRDTIEAYVKLSGQESQFSIARPESPTEVFITGVRVVNDKGEPTNEVPHDEDFRLTIDVGVNQFRRGATLCIALLNKYKRRVFTEHKLLAKLFDDKPGEYTASFRVPDNFIAPNNYSFMVQIFNANGEVPQDLFDICPFEVIDAGSKLAAYRDHGYVMSQGEWSVEPK
jgi:lipopolysaccharide transport system ATP-binding protein